MQVEILDGYAALAPWMTPEALAVARRAAHRHGLTGTDLDVAVEAAALVMAARARGQGLPPSDPAHRVAFFPPDTPAETILARLVRVGRALRRSPAVAASLRNLGAGTAEPTAARLTIT